MKSCEWFAWIRVNAVYFNGDREWFYDRWKSDGDNDISIHLLSSLFFSGFFSNKSKQTKINDQTMNSMNPHIFWRCKKFNRRKIPIDNCLTQFGIYWTSFDYCFKKKEFNKYPFADPTWIPPIGIVWALRLCTAFEFNEWMNGCRALINWHDDTRNTTSFSFNPISALNQKPN